MSESSEVRREGAPCPRNIRITLEYDGRNYVGWETQKNGTAIQAVVEAAIERITRERTFVNGSGRTDAGVHALGQVANFTLAHRMPTSDLHRALNAVLPDDIVILAMDEVPLTFHARFSATGKTYCYRLWNSPSRTALERDRTHYIRSPLDIEAMRAAAGHLVGRHDFSSFTKEAAALGSCVREVYAIDVSTDGRRVDIEVRGEGFLYNMVRIISGTLVHVGLGKLAANDIPRIRDARDRNLAGPTLPPCGLHLVRVSYDGSPGDESERLKRLLECMHPADRSGKR